MIFRILTDAKTSARLNELATERHEKRLRTVADYAHISRRVWETRPQHVGLVRYAFFRLLHEEFSGSGLMGLPFVLGGGRKLARALPWLKKVGRPS